MKARLGGKAGGGRTGASARPGFLAALALAGILAGCEDAILPEGPGTGAIQNFEFVWDEMDRHYSLFRIKGVDWDSAYAEFRPQVEGTTSPSDLFHLLAGMLDGLEDGHVKLESPNWTHTYDEWYKSYRHNFNWPYIWNQQILNRGTTPTGRFHFGWITFNIGYIHIPSFAGGGWAHEVDTVLERLSGIQALIVDIRDNTGGSDRNAERVAGRFARERTLYRRIQYRNGPGHDDFTPLEDDYLEPRGASRFHGPLAVLTNRRTFSAAESFVLAMRAVPGAVQVGDNTGGGSGNPFPREMPNGWTFTISRWIEWAPDGTTHEGRGFAPDIPAFIPEDGLGYTDPILRAAVQHLIREIS
ncbi:MAG: S41 family peptidase [Longimicrobiales bacterium]